VIVMMGSGCETADETVNLLCASGAKVGFLKVRLFRPFSVNDFLAAFDRGDKMDRARGAFAAVSTLARLGRAGVRRATGS